MFFYMESSPKLSGKARDFGASYRRMAVVEVEGTERPKMISERAKGVVRIVRDEVASVGSTERSYGYRVMRELKQLAIDLNGAA